MCCLCAAEVLISDLRCLVWDLSCAFLGLLVWGFRDCRVWLGFLAVVCVWLCILMMRENVFRLSI